MQYENVVIHNLDVFLHLLGRRTLIFFWWHDVEKDLIAAYAAFFLVFLDVPKASKITPWGFLKFSKIS